MKRILYIFIALNFLFLAKEARAQQEPMFTHYMFNSMALNPGYAGTKNALSVSALSRLQWVGLDGAPRTQAISLHSPINSKNVGIGFSLISDKIGPLSNTYFTFNYAYRVQLSEKLILSLGLKAGFYNFHLGLNELSINDVEDPRFYTNPGKAFVPNLGAGAYLYNKRFYLGLAAPKIIETNYEEGESSTNEISTRRHYYLMAGYVTDINSDLKFKPSFSARMVEGAPISLDFTALFFIKERIWIGPMYRLNDALGLLADFKVNSQLTIGYSYDYSVSKLVSYNKGSHELLVSYDLDGFLNKKIKSPRYF